MHAFDYAAPETLDEAVALLTKQDGHVRVLSGGTDLLAQLKDGKGSPSLVVDIKHIPDLMAFTCDASRGLTLGAGVPCHVINNDNSIQKLYPALLDSSSLIGGTQIQGRATIGGNLCNSSPAADSIPNLIAHKAVANVTGPDGDRSVPVSEFCTGPGSNVLKAGELLVSLHLPAPVAGFGAGYLRFIPRNEMGHCRCRCRRICSPRWRHNPGGHSVPGSRGAHSAFGKGGWRSFGRSEYFGRPFCPRGADSRRCGPPHLGYARHHCTTQASGRSSDSADPENCN